MLKKVLAVLLGIAMLAGAAWAIAVELAERKARRSVDVRVVPVAPSKDAASLRHGKYLYESRGCGECHGRDGRGRVMIDDGGGMFVRTPNLTGGKAGVVAGYSDGDWVRAIRHGVDPRGRPLLVMPSQDYNRMTDADLAALVGYIKALPPVDGEPAQVRFPALVKALYGLGLVHDSAGRIDHRVPPALPVPAAVTPEHGAYVASMCTGCHGRVFSGGKVPGAPPEWPPASNLTPGEGGVMTRYESPESFAAMLRSGKRPDGSDVSKVMPFEALRNLNDTDVHAMHAFLRTLPPRRTGQQ